MPQSVAHGSQLTDCLVELLCFGGEPLSIDPQLPVWRKHESNFIQRETGSLSQ
jgi:hypothetical protein